MEEFNEFEELTLTPEELALEEIRSAVDYTSTTVKYGVEKFELINYIDESSLILNKKVRTTFLYNENGGGNGVNLEIL